MVYYYFTMESKEKAMTADKQGTDERGTAFLKGMTPDRLKSMTAEEVEALLPGIRRRITEVVSRNGGHLASNLGVVELTVALHRVFDVPRDKIIFDVGHQCYTHKILTGRDEQMDTLRTFGGVSGFPKHGESVCDAYETGHASTALSAAVGMARARDLSGGGEHIVAVVGDGAFTGGMCYEALNDAGSRPTRLIAILNDNQMSIAHNVGALSNYLSYMRVSKGWLDAKKAVTEFLRRVPLVGGGLYAGAQKIKNHIRDIFVHDGFFDALGFRYIGPVDGQDERLLEKMLARAKRLEKPVLLHVVTTKGSGYAPAEMEPDRMHGTPPFDLENGRPIKTGGARAFGAALGGELVKIAGENPRVAAISAAMVESTGLGAFRAAFPERLFDVGIAEEHAVTLAAGMARGGLRPVVAVYDTFMQRAYDQVIEDVCLQNLPVVFLMDRAGIGGEDGPTHHGVFGTAMLRPVPNISVLYPRTTDEARAMLRRALEKESGATAILYPKAEGTEAEKYPQTGFEQGVWNTLEKGKDLALVALGTMADTALKVREGLMKHGLPAEVVSANSVKPLDTACLEGLMRRGLNVYTLEEELLAGGLGSAVCEWAAENGARPPRGMFALRDKFVAHGERERLLREEKMDAASICENILKGMGKQ